MEFSFNDLSEAPVSPDRHSANAKMAIFSQAAAAGRRRGIRNIRSPKSTAEILLTAGYSIHDWLNNREIGHELRNNLYGIIIQPFIGDEHDTQLEKYLAIDTCYFEERAAGIPKQECLGLISAHFYGAGSLSLDSAVVWEQRWLTIHIKSGLQESPVKVLNTFSPACFDNPEVVRVIEYGVELELLETDIAPTEKNFHLTGHHGQKELKNLWERVRRCSYVLEGLTVEWGGSNFIREVSPYGYITIVLTDTRDKYALRIRTTGRNQRETQAIADYIQDHYE